MDTTARVLRNRGVKYQLRRISDGQLQMIIENTLVQIDSERGFLHLLQAELAARRLGVPRRSRLGEESLF
jgi:hypothetical protein